MRRSYPSGNALSSKLSIYDTQWLRLFAIRPQSIIAPMRKPRVRQTSASSPSVTGRLVGQPWLLAALLAVITFAAYFPALRGSFVFDDDSLIVHNRLIHADDGLHRFWFTTEAPDYWPLTSTLWWLEWRAWGDHATGYHVVSVLLHVISAILIWMILRRLKIPGAWLVGIAFAIHPVNVATVAWISEQKNTLSMLFYTAAILLYLSFDESNRWRTYALSLTAFVLALLSKTGVVMLPIVLLLCGWWRHGRLQRRDLLRMIPFFALSLASGLTTIWFQYNRAIGSAPNANGGFYGPPRRCGLRALVLSVQDATAGGSDRGLSQVGDRCVLLGFICAGNNTDRLPRGLLVEAENVGTTVVLRAGIFSGDALPGIGIL